MSRSRLPHQVGPLLLLGLAACSKPLPVRDPGQILAEADADPVRANYTYDEKDIVIRSTLEEKRLGTTTYATITPQLQERNYHVQEGTESYPLFILGPEGRVRAVMYGPKERVMAAQVGEDLELTCRVGGFTDAHGRLLLDLDLCVITN